MAKPKSKMPLIVFALVAGGVALYVFTTPEATPAKKTSSTHATVAAKTMPGDLITDADRTARFDAYKGPRHDAFQPGVTIVIPGQNGTAKGGRGTWVLTGITSLDGHATALVENLVANESQMLRTGDHWNDERVLRVGEDSVTLINAQGKSFDLTFPPPEDESKKNSGTPEPEEVPTPTPAPPVIIQPTITIQAPQGGGGGGQNFPNFGGGGGQDGGPFGQGGFPGGGPGGPGGGPGGPGGPGNN